MKQFKFGMIMLNVVTGSFFLAGGVYLAAGFAFTLAYLWTRYEA